MNYEIIDYRIEAGVSKKHFLIEAQVRTKHRFLFFFRWHKDRWINVGRQGYPRFYYRNIAGQLYTNWKNGLIVCDTKLEAEQIITQLKHRDSYKDAHRDTDLEPTYYGEPPAQRPIYTPSIEIKKK